MIFLLLVILLILVIFKSLHSIIWVPWRIQQFFRKQGVYDPTYRPFYGNIAEIKQMTKEAQSKFIPFTHDIVHRVCPDYYHWSAMYGKTFLCWFGLKPRLALADPDMIKDIFPNTSDTIDKLEFNPMDKLLFGQGLPGLTGHKWAAHRKIATPAFNMEEVKAWEPEMVASVTKMLENWEVKREERDEFEMDIYNEFHDLPAEILSKTAFGSSFEERKSIFELQEQVNLTMQALQNVYIPGFRFLPSKMNKWRWRLEKETRDSIRMIIETYSKTTGNSKNLISLLMSGSSNMKAHGLGLDIEEVIDECKTFYFAGKETTANAVTWAVLLLAQHQEWQSKARKEVLQVCKDNDLPTAEKLHEFKIHGFYDTERNTWTL